MSNQEPNKPPQFRISRGLYLAAAAILGLWIFVTFFFRNPYTQAVSGGDYYDKHPYDESSVWTLVLVIVPAIGAAAAIYSWFRQRQQG